MQTSKLVAAASICGALTGLVGNLLTPRYHGDDVDTYRRMAVSDRFTVSAVVVLVAVLLVSVAFLGLLRDLGERHAGLSSYGRLAVAGGATLALLYAGLRLYGVKQQARAFAGANRFNQDAAFWATNAVDHVSQTVFALWTTLLLGIAPILIGTGQRRDAIPGRRVAAGALGGGVVCAVVGFASLFAADQSTFEVPFLIGSLLVTFWLLATGAAAWRSLPPDAAAAEPATGSRSRQLV